MKAANPGFDSGFKGLTYLLPTCLRNLIKGIYRRIMFLSHRIRHVKKGRFAYLGPHFRFSRAAPYNAYIGAKTNVEEFNIWNAQSGNIKAGENCFFGLYNVVMGPLEIGDRVSTGPFVQILGPRHAMLGQKEGMTVIGNNVWLSAGCIIHFGVKIGDNAVIGPGSVVTKDVPENAYVAGNPARNITELSNLKEFMQRRGKNVNAGTGG